MAEISSLEWQFDLLWEELYPNIDLETEVPLIKGRRYKFDYVNIEAKIAIEVQGQIWQAGGHNTGKSLLRDYEKYNLAQNLGYKVYQLSSEMIVDEWIHLIAIDIECQKLLNANSD